MKNIISDMQGKTWDDLSSAQKLITIFCLVGILISFVAIPSSLLAAAILKFSGSPEKIYLLMLFLASLVVVATTIRRLLILRTVEGLIVPILLVSILLASSLTGLYQTDSYPLSIESYSNAGLSDFIGLCVIAVAFVVALILYFVPSVIAQQRQHPNNLAIFFLNLTLGWTFLGWVASLVWSGTSVSKH